MPQFRKESFEVRKIDEELDKMKMSEVFGGSPVKKS